MPTPKIPDDIYESRCKYCTYFCPEGENRVFQDNEVYSYSIKHSCKILSIAGYSYQVWNDEGKVIDEIAYDDGECRSFLPWYSYPGICASCAYHNHFVEGCCTNSKRGSDYHPAFIARQYGEKAEYLFYTCSKWKMNDRMKDYYLHAIVLGRVPPILDENFELVSPQKASEAALKWAQFREEELAKIEKAKPPKEEFGRQLSLFD